VKKLIGLLFLLAPHVATAASMSISPDTPALMRAALRSAPQTKASPRLNPPSQPVEAAPAIQQDFGIQTKVQYINYLRNAATGSKSDCADKYNKFNNFFNHDSTMSGQIVARDSAAASGRLDNICDFLGYAHWCFALGFAYAVRDLDDVQRTGLGNKCLTYQEFCNNNKKTLDNNKINEYLSKVIDEIMFYQENIKGTNKNTVATTTETKSGPSVTTSVSWRVYDIDSWVDERVPTAEKVKLLCR
jgi:hypothetical protein